jgi:thiosulfate/3-mercaptopyruvate sulfurtransferase
MLTTLIDARELQGNLDNPDWVIIDARYDLAARAAGRRAWLAGHIPGAVYADLEKDLSAAAGPAGRHPLPDPERMRSVFSRLGIATGRQVVAYDDTFGAMAARLWWMLRFMGHDSVAVLDGGWREWRRRGLPEESGERHNRPASFRGEPRQDWLLTVNAVPAAPRLIDSRAPERYRGDTEPIDPVAGHIPGAVNYYWQRNLEENGLFRAAAEIRRDLQSILAGVPAQEAAFYCGSGVTACHNLLAAAHAGLPAPRLYAGSWSEWCRDPARGVATGTEA